MKDFRFLLIETLMFEVYKWMFQCTCIYMNYCDSFHLSGQGQNPARKSSINAGLPIHVPACGVNMLCGSGLRAVVLGYQAIKTGDADIVVAGGQENMSLASTLI